MELTGRRIDGVVQHRTGKGPLVARSCWCRDCRDIAGGGGALTTILKTDAISLEGESEEYVPVARSGNAMRWKFRRACETRVVATPDRRPPSPPTLGS